VGASIEGETRSTSSAILKCGPIIWENLASGVSELKTWGKENAKYILEKDILTREHGFFIVTAIRKTKWCKLKCLATNSQSVASMLSAGSTLTGAQIDAKTKVETGETLSAGWIVRPTNDENVSLEN
jgi:hypothetical protein